MPFPVFTHTHTHNGNDTLPCNCTSHGTEREQWKVVKIQLMIIEKKGRGKEGYKETDDEEEKGNRKLAKI
jgi:hypothetical protein